MLVPPATQCVLVVPSDTVDLPREARGLYVTVAGNVVFNVNKRDTTAVTLPVTVGQVLPIQVARVFATGTTATVYALT